MEKTPIPPEVPLPKKRTLFARGLHGLRVAVVVFLAASLAGALILHFVPPPATPLMILRLLDQHAEGKPLRLKKTWKPLSQISPYLPAAVVASEDQLFFDHHGFDAEAIRNAFRRNQRGRRIVGASTISQQTAKNLFLWPARSWTRKGLEAYFTLLMELLWPKHRILEMYLNIVEFGDGIYGAEAASRYYFHRPARDLTREQAALLASILPKPRSWSPVSPNGRVARREAWILWQMPAFVGRRD